ncbi:hypothetical protein ACFVVQ_12250 [Paenibacillus chitinolyticus]|uniref:hypothetical protein n=1 Tax=Paenibacillus chitinolyticus TaxID=79263 RepID=UPI0036D79637
MGPLITDDQLTKAEKNLKKVAKEMREKKVSSNPPHDKEGKKLVCYGARTVRLTLMMIHEIRTLREKIKQLEAN